MEQSLEELVIRRNTHQGAMLLGWSSYVRVKYGQTVEKFDEVNGVLSDESGS